MASFNFEGAVEGGITGAGTGALFGGVGAIPGAVIGFALGGFLGGKGEDAAKRREAQLQFLASPQHFMDVAREVTPQQVALANRSVGPAAASAAATQSARRDLTSTGLGAALAINAAAAPGIAGAKAGNAVAQGIVGREIAALGGTPNPGLVGLATGGLPGDTFSQLGALNASLGLKKNARDNLLPTPQPGQLPGEVTPPGPGGNVILPPIPRQQARRPRLASNPFATA